MSSPQNILKQFISQRPEVARWLVAYSGGLDSTLLLHSVVQVLKGLNSHKPVLAIHVHHNLSASADAWEAHCRQCCDTLSVEFMAARVNFNPEGRGLESAAREARYRVFEQQTGAGDGLLMAHHLDDQAETLLLRLMRGSGPKGLSAMAVERPLAEGRLFRPWLSIGRSEIEAEATALGLCWIEDESNQSREFDRNFLRHDVMPQLQQRWPGFAERWRQSAQLCRQSQILIEQIAAEDLAAATPRAERKGFSVSWEPLAALDSFRRGNALRSWFQQLSVEAPDSAQLGEVERQLFSGREESEAAVSWGANTLRCFQGRLYWFVAEKAEVPDSLIWSGLEPLYWGDWKLSLVKVGKGGFAIPRQGFKVSRRFGGERCQPVWRARSQTLKKLLQEAELEPWLRYQLPLLKVNDDIISVGDLWVCRGWQVSSGYQLLWQYVPEQDLMDARTSENQLPGD